MRQNSINLWDSISKYNALINTHIPLYVVTGLVSKCRSVKNMYTIFKFQYACTLKTRYSANYAKQCKVLHL